MMLTGRILWTMPFFVGGGRDAIDGPGASTSSGGSFHPARRAADGVFHR